VNTTPDPVARFDAGLAAIGLYIAELTNSEFAHFAATLLRVARTVQNRGVALIRVVIVGPVGDHDISVPLSDQAGDDTAVLDGRDDLAVMDILSIANNASEPKTCRVRRLQGRPG